MKHRITLAAAAIAFASLSMVTAQSVPSAPRNLRIVTSPPATPAPPPCLVPAAAGGAHAYFDALVRRPEHACNWSLRDQAQLDSLAADRIATFFTYNPGGDTYPDAQDAAKFYVPAGRATASIPVAQQLRMPVPRVESGTVIITWDWYWGPEFRLNRGAMTAFKTFHVRIGGHHWWTLMSNLAQASKDEGGVVTRISDEFVPGPDRPNGMISHEVVNPTGPGAVLPQRTYQQFHSRWTRYWIEVKLLQSPSAFTDWSNAYLGGATLNSNPDDPQGRWHMVSLWSADEHRPPQRLLYRIPMPSYSTSGLHISRFDFEMNTSQQTGFIGPWIGYGRNVAVLHNYALPSVPEADTFLFQRPRR